jgi:hypothetical protein
VDRPGRCRLRQALIRFESGAVCQFEVSWAFRGARLPDGHRKMISPACLFERLAHDGAGQPVEFVRSLFRGDRYTLVAELVLPDAGGRP